METNTLTRLPSDRKHIVTLAGYIEDIPSKVDETLALYMVSAYDQSYCWGEVPSLSRALQKGGNNINDCSRFIQDDLSSLFNYKFDKSKVTVTEANPELGNPLVTLNIDIEVFDVNYQDKLVRILELDQGKFKRLIKLNNG